MTFDERVVERTCASIDVGHLAEQDLDHIRLREIRDQVRFIIDDELERRSVVLTSGTKTWLMNEYFKRIPITSDVCVESLIIINEQPFIEVDRVKLEELLGPSLSVGRSFSSVHKDED